MTTIWSQVVRPEARLDRSGTTGDNDAGHWGYGNGQEILLLSDLRLDFLGHWVTKDLHKLDV